MIRFKDVVLDDTRAIGIASDKHTYCVAPLMSKRVSVEPWGEPPEIQFWAVGRDCCNRRQSFECDAASVSPFVKSGIVVHPPEQLLTSQWFTPRSHVDQYMESVRASIA